MSEKALPDSYEWGAFGLVADPVAPSGFYVTDRKKVGETTTRRRRVYTRFKYFAQRWEPEGAAGWRATTSTPPAG